MTERFSVLLNISNIHIKSCTMQQCTCKFEETRICWNYIQLNVFLLLQIFLPEKSALNSITKLKLDLY